MCILAYVLGDGIGYPTKITHDGKDNYSLNEYYGVAYE